MATDRPRLPHMLGARATFDRLYGNPTMAVLFALGFAGGLPNVISSSVAPAWATTVGWRLSAIGALGFLSLPYALKFLWAPLVDGLRLPLLGRLGRRRSWLLLSQVGACGALLACALWGPVAVPEDPQSAQLATVHNTIFFVLLGLAVVFSATQDIAADAYRADILEPAQLGAGAGVFVTGYRIAFVLLGGGVLIAADHIGWKTAVACASVLMLVGIGSTLAAREPELPRGARPGIVAAVVEPLVIFWRTWRLRVLFLAAFVLIFKLPDQLTTAITTPLLMQGLGYSAESIGWVRQGFGFAMTIVGAGVGGWMVARLGIMRCLWIFGILHSVSIAGFLLLALAYGATVHASSIEAPPIAALMPVIALENLVIGMVTSGFVAYLMGVCDRRYTATQYALLTALMAANNSLAGGLSGELAERLDYEWFLIAAMCAGIPGVALIPFVRPPKPAP